LFWLLVQFKKPQGLALLRFLSNFRALIEELYVRRVGYRSNLYAIKVNGRYTTAERFARSLGRMVELEVVAVADGLTLGEGWERVEFAAGGLGEEALQKQREAVRRRRWFNINTQ